MPGVVYGQIPGRPFNRMTVPCTYPASRSTTSSGEPQRCVLRSSRPDGNSTGHIQVCAFNGRSRIPKPTTTTGRWFLSVRYPYPENRCLPTSPSDRRAPVTAIENLSTSAGRLPSPTPGDRLLHACREDTLECARIDDADAGPERREAHQSGRERDSCTLLFHKQTPNRPSDCRKINLFRRRLSPCAS